jgi:predicted amidohydrolase
MNSGSDRDLNLEAAERLVANAADEGAELVVLPEKWPLLGSPETLLEGAEPLDGPAISSAATWASERGIFLLAGSFAERRAGREKLSNTSVLLGPDGDIVAVYRKIHLFDVDVDGVQYRESATEEPGDEVVDAPLGETGFDLGMTICFDLRFPELFRILSLRGANIIAVPSAFTRHTGAAHWEVLLRARAIENQTFIAAANQIGRAESQYDSFGNSLLCDAWGTVLTRVADGVGVAVADCDLSSLASVRDRIPAMDSRRPESYSWPGIAELTQAVEGAV